MPNITPLQNNFSVGEVSPDLYYRSTLQAQRYAVVKARNMIPDPRGPIGRRPGFRFLGKVGIPQTGLRCGPAQLINADEFGDGVAGTNNYGALRWIYVDPDTMLQARNSVVFTLSRSGGNVTDTVFEVDPLTDTVTAFSDLQVTGSSGLVSPPGLIGSHRYLSVSTQGVATDRNIRYFDAVTGNQALNFILNQSRSTSFLCENENYVAYWQSAFTTIIIIRKATWTWHSVADPSGWEFLDQSAARRSDLQFIVPLRNTGTGNYTFFNYSELTPPDEVIDRLADCRPEIDEFAGIPYERNGLLFWPVRDNFEAKILVTDFFGAEIAYVDLESGANWTVGVGSEVFTADEADANFFFFLHASRIWRFNTTDLTFETCTLDEINPLIYGFLPSVQHVGDFIYMADPRDQAGNRVFAKQQVF